MKYLLLRINYL